MTQFGEVTDDDMQWAESVVYLNPPTAECCICGAETLLTHSVAYYCGPTHDEIGSMSSAYPGGEVGGMPACRACHDNHYGLAKR